MGLTNRNVFITTATVLLFILSFDVSATAQTLSPEKTKIINPHGSSDFNSDGFQDLVIAAIGEEINDVTNAGAVTILYGNESGTINLSSFVHQNTLGVPGDSQRGDQFGFATISTDFNQDGYSDLIIGSPSKNADDIEDSGGVWIFFGGEGGIYSEIGSSKFIHQGLEMIPTIPEQSDHWGFTLETGDFDLDGFGDIVISAPGKTINGKENSGEITILYGNRSRNLGQRVRTFNQSDRHIPDAAESDDRWGSALASGDFNGDGFSDLAIGSPGERWGDYTEVGAITILYGSKNGLKSEKSVRLHQSTPGVPDKNEPNDQWGSNLISGDFNNDGYEDIAIGTPNESSGDQKETGTITILQGSSLGITTQKSKFIHKGSLNIPGNIASYDRWGSVLIAADFNKDGYVDIVAGTPDETVGLAYKSGSLTLLNGSAIGPIGKDSFTLNQISPGINGVSENADFWADSLAVTDLNGDGHADLVVSATTESVGTHFDTGSITFIWGSEEGINQAQSLTINQDSQNVPSENKSNDYWGRLGTTGTLSPQRPQTALRTAAGVNVSLLAQMGDKYIVRTPCGNPVIVSGGDELKNIQIVIDPGHGGVDVGAAHHGLIERKINLIIAEELAIELNSRGLKTVLTRTGNYHMPLSSRGQFADHVNAKAMISIHHNAPAGARSYEPGVETFVQTGSPLSEYLGFLVYQNTFNALKQFNWVSWTSAADAGVIRVLNNQGKDTYGMMSRPKTPTTLIELAYIANPSEAALVKTNEYLSAVVQALADASQTFIETSTVEIETFSNVRRYTAGEAPGYNVCSDPILQSLAEVISKAIQEAIDNGTIPK